MILRSKVVSLLSEVPGAKLQLFKFREMFEKRYHASIGVSDLYKMKECVIITEEQSGRMVQLSGAPYGTVSVGGSYNQVRSAIGASMYRGNGNECTFFIDSAVVRLRVIVEGWCAQLQRGLHRGWNTGRRWDEI